MSRIFTAILLMAFASPLWAAEPRTEHTFQLEADEKRLLSDLIACENIVRLLGETQRRRASTERSCELELADRNGETRWYRVTARNFASMDREATSGGQGAVAARHQHPQGNPETERGIRLVG